MTRPEIKLSIIIPVYNVVAYLEDCLNSLVYQDVSTNCYEIICVNDGSTDKCGEILDKYAVKCSNLSVFHKENGGVSSARNLGIEHANGDYIWFVDSDDIVAVNSLSYIINSLNQFNPDVLQIGIKAFQQSELFDDAKMLPIDDEAVRYYSWIPAEIFKSEIIRDYNILFDCNLHWGEDDVFSVFVYQHASKIIDLGKIVYYYRQREGSALHTSISEENIDKIIKTYSADLQYAKNYSFFDYKKDGVYKRMPNLINYIARQPFKKANRHLKKLKEHNLYPLPIYKNLVNENDKISGAKKLRCYSCEHYFFFLLLRFYIRLNKKK